MSDFSKCGTNRPMKKRGHGTSLVVRLLQQMEKLTVMRHHEAYRSLQEQSIHAAFFLSARERVKHNYKVSFDGAVIVYSLQNNLLKHEEWEGPWADMYKHSPEWCAAIDDLFHQIMGRKPDRTNKHTLAAEAESIWRLIQLPYSEQQLRALAGVQDYLYKCAGQVTEAQSQALREPPRFNGDELVFPMTSKHPATQPEARSTTSKPAQQPTDDSMLLLAALLLTQRITELLEAKTKACTSAPKEENPEQVDAEDQERIDQIAAELLDSIDW